MKYKDHKHGVIVFDNALNVDKSFIKEYINWLRENDESVFQKVTTEEGSHAVNRSGFKFNLNSLETAPDRFTDTVGSHSGRKPKQEYQDFIKACADATYRCLVEYCSIYTEAASTIWWRGHGHIAGYTEGKMIGPHCDNRVQFDFTELPKVTMPFHNVISAALYLNDCLDDGSQVEDGSFSGGHIKFKYAGLDYAPKAGSVVLYPSNYIGTHEVTPVTAGERYAFLQFFAYGVPTNPDGLVNDGGNLDWLKDLESDSRKVIEANRQG